MKNFKLNHPDLIFYNDTNLEKYTTIKLGKQGHLVEVKTKQALADYLAFLDEHQIPFRMVGWGANQILHRTDVIYLKLGFEFDKTYLQDYRSEYILPASIGLNQLTAAAIRHGLGGWELFTGVPASLGGAICMNAGTSLGEMCELVKQVEIFSLKKGFFLYSPDAKSFSYRNNNFLKPDEIVVGATLIHRGKNPKVPKIIREYLQYRKSTQPVGTKNCGSVFKNQPELRAGRAIDLVGLKGYGFPHLKVSMKHGNFIEHQGGASTDDFLELIESLQHEIEMTTGQKFELEVKIH